MTPVENGEVRSPAEKVTQSRVRDLAALIESNTFEVVLGLHRKTYTAHDLPARLWFRRATEADKTVKDVEVVLASLRITEEELFDVVEASMSEVVLVARMIVDHFLALCVDPEVREAAGMRVSTSPTSRTGPEPSPPASDTTPGTPSEDS